MVKAWPNEDKTRFVYENGRVVKNNDVPLPVSQGRHIVTFSVKDLVYQAKETDRLWVALCRAGRTGKTMVIFPLNQLLNRIIVTNCIFLKILNLANGTNGAHLANALRPVEQREPGEA